MMAKEGGEKLENRHEEAEKDYINGRTYKEIALKHNVSENTVKSWKSRYGWVRVKKKRTSKKVHTKKKKVALKKCAQNTKGDEALEETGELSEKMQQFCVFYVKCFNGTKAYMKAYGTDYASAAAGASRLLKNVKIKNYIRELKAQRASIALFDKEDLVQRYMDIMYLDIHEFADINKSGTRIRIKHDFDGTLVNQIKETQNGIDIRLPDRMKAMEWLDRYFEVNPQAQRKKEYEKLKEQQLKQEIEKNRRLLEEEEDEKETYGVVLLAPVLEDEEDGEDECIMDSTTEAN